MLKGRLVSGLYLLPHLREVKTWLRNVERKSLSGDKKHLGVVKNSLKFTSPLILYHGVLFPGLERCIINEDIHRIRDSWT
jgi:hypothetical protein